MARTALRRLESWVIVTGKRLIMKKGSYEPTDSLSNDPAASAEKRSQEKNPILLRGLDPTFEKKELRKEREGEKETIAHSVLLERGFKGDGVIIASFMLSKGKPTRDGVELCFLFAL
ncbi:hypothetical protein TNCV_4469411 [Trichonephila clavipes]|nr:hypothetical protein TNCV_4469411 [Trichonephila clavipes]